MSQQHFVVREHHIATQHIREYPGALAGDQEDVLQICVKQYIPTDQSENASPDAITVIGAHANGFPKVLDL